MPGSRHGPGRFVGIGQSAPQVPIHLVYVTYRSTARRNMEAAQAPVQGAAAACADERRRIAHFDEAGSVGDSLVRGVRGSSLLNHGCSVRIKGLVSATQHNGKEGVLICLDKVNGR
jgi:hypothetical protein